MQLDLFISISEAERIEKKVDETKESVRKTQKGLFARIATMLGMICKNEDNIQALRKRIEAQEAIIRDLNYRLSDIERTYSDEFIQCVQ